jgi:cyclophilin family peptidyl-prolyl cis-trans isomerase
MFKKVTLAFSLLLLLTLAIGCGGNGKNGDTESKKSEVPADLDQSTPQFTGADRASFVHPILNKSDKFVTLETNYGKMVAELYHDLAPAHADSFAARANDGFYNNTAFHRVIDNFMIQGGGFNPDGSHKPVSYTIPAEFSAAKHYEGTLSMARAPDPNSASTQFFVCLGRNRSTASLDNLYTVFGQLISGYDTLAKIGKVAVQRQPQTGEMSVPVEPVILVKAYLSDAQGNPVK